MILQEVQALGKRGYLRAFFLSMYTFCNKLTPYLSIMMYVVLGSRISADKAFFTVAVFQNIIESMVFYFSSAVGSGGEVWTSINRLQKFLLLEDRNPQTLRKYVEDCNRVSSKVYLENATARYLSSNHSHLSNKIKCNAWRKYTQIYTYIWNFLFSWADMPTLKNVNLDLKGDRLVMLVGGVGSGKSSLLHILIDELQLRSGKCEVTGEITYAGQEAWLFAGTVRENILFNLEFDKQRYHEIIHVCCLQEDMDQLPNGDMSLVGERGVVVERFNENDIPEDNIEKIIEGTVSSKTYWIYCLSGDSILGFLFVVCSFFVAQIIVTANDYWLSHWTTAEENYITNSSSADPSLTPEFSYFKSTSVSLLDPYNYLIFTTLWALRSVYVKTSRDVKRLESVAKSPVFNHLAATMQGLTTIRALKSQDCSIKTFDEYQDIHSSPWFIFIATTRGFAIWIETLSVTFLTIITFTFLLFVEETSAGVVQLHDAIGHLDARVDDGGSNFSIGERQMICLCRLHSVMQSDKLIVLDNGSIQEYDHPHILLQNPTSELSKLVDHTGTSGSAHLRILAKRHYEALHQQKSPNGVIGEVAQPISLRMLVKSFESGSTISSQDQIIYAVTVCVTTFIHNFIMEHSVFLMLRTGQICRISCSSILYQKVGENTIIMKLSPTARKEATTGKMMNLMANDLGRFDQGLIFLAYTFLAPLQTAVFIYFLFVEIEFGTVGGAGLVILILPLQMVNGRWTAKFRESIAKQTDERSKIMNEIVMAIRVIKMMAWEKPFTQLVNHIRRMEVKALGKKMYLRGFYLCMFTVCYKLTPFLSILLYVLLGSRISADKAFFIVAVFQIIIENMIYYNSIAVNSLGEIWVSIQRVQVSKIRAGTIRFRVLTISSNYALNLQQVLLMDEQVLEIEGKKQTTTEDASEPQITLSNVTARWSAEESPVVSNFNLNIKGNRLVMVVGAVGSGKSLGVVVVVIWSNYFLTIPSSVIIILVLGIRHVFLKTSRDLKRVESQAKSPVLTHLAASIQGMTTIRALKSQANAVNTFNKLQNNHTSPWFLFLAATRCFTVWIGTLSAVYLTVIIVTFMLMTGDLASGLIGFVIASTISLAANLQWALREGGDAENYMTCVARSIEYTKLPSEAAWESEPDKKPPADWPKGGGLKFENVTLSYGDTDVLKDLSFEIKPKQKVGIVQLKKAVEALDASVEDGGQNFSIGQRQLICLARALLRKNCLIVMDEATANATIRDKFRECSILTIAHRLQSVMDCDMVLVLEKGVKMEYDHPYILLQKEDGFLHQLVSWVIPLFRKGYRKDLALTDIYRVIPEDETRKLADRLEAAWFEQIAQTESKSSKKNANPKAKLRKPSLIKALVKVFGPRNSLLGLCALFEECVIKIVQPIILGQLLEYFHDPSKFQPYEGYLYGLALILCIISYTSMDHPFTFAVQHMGMQTRISLCALVYRKSLRVSQYALEQMTAGTIINFLSSDMNRFDLFFTYFHYIWYESMNFYNSLYYTDLLHSLVAPVQLALVIGTLYWYVDLGYPAFCGLLLVVVFVPLQSFMGHTFGKLRAKTASKTDDRLVWLEEILAAIRVIKMYAWEEPFSNHVTETRRAEIHMLQKTAIRKAINQSFFAITSRTTLFVTLLTYSLTGGVLIAKKSFLLLDERIPPDSSTMVQVDRIRKYDVNLSTDAYSLDSSVYTTTSTSYDGSSTLCYEDLGVKVNNMTAQWNPITKENAFSNVSFEVKAGKSSILNSLLYELPIKSGEFHITGKIAYSSQEPWIFNGSVRENILFGKPYSSKWYDQVTEACALTRDFQLLPYGDHTMVGEKGTALSGGQKSRINLARAVYSDADILYLDDPLSAVDAQVARHIMENCILGLLKDTCIILVTHQLQHIKHVDQVLLMVDGSIAHIGNHKTLKKSGIPYSELLNPANESVPPKKGISVASISTHVSSSTMAFSTAAKFTAMDPALVKVGETVLETPEQEAEYVATGSVGLKVYWEYLASGSGTFKIFVLLFLTIVAQFLFTGTDLWLNFICKISMQKQDGTFKRSSNPILGHFEDNAAVEGEIYMILIAASFILYNLRTQTYYKHCMKCSMKIYDILFYSVLRSPMTFFERTPIGRILNRFAKDISCVDEYLPQTLYDSVEIFMQTVGVCVVVSINSPFLLAPCVILFFVFFFLRKFYFRTARDIKRLEGIARSPIFSHLSTSLNGLSTIRAFGVQEKFVRDFECIQSIHTSVWFMFLNCTRWLGVVVDWVICAFVMGVTLNFLFRFEEFKGSNSAVVGVSISCAMTLTSMVQWGMRQSAEVENHLIAFERVQQYCSLPSESSLESTPDQKPPPTWPNVGEIKIQNLCLRFKGSDNFILKNINCTIYGGEKVGIVGRTGAGKSSLINALFRLVEPTSGLIEIDSIVTTNIGLHDLRGKMSIIPQDPVVFMGTIRSNLDPFSMYSDDSIWNALREVKMTECVKDMEGGLDSEICEGGHSFSLGQKQLLCLSRAILQHNKILVMDEATASVDPAYIGP
ncbi:Multidrug resistance-associated protein 4 [Orchesella cincta]|uniref:Multidrug resistance-associated protein 4 n=1 Tax=Orchesella cincta TaxID=48709 RepID=A0A1D2NA23_ORCCI|nr:Multidrug resistance-associated protein 4 [Orchesella cincta]